MRRKTTLCQMIIVCGFALQAYSRPIDSPTSVISNTDFREHCDRLQLDQGTAHAANDIHARYRTDSYNAKQAVDQLDEWFESIDARSLGGENAAIIDIKGHSYRQVHAAWRQSFGDLDDAYFESLRRAYPQNIAIIDEISRQRLRRRFLSRGTMPGVYLSELSGSNLNLVQILDNHRDRDDFTPEMHAAILEYELGMDEILREVDDIRATYIFDKMHATNSFYRELPKSEIDMVLNACIKVFAKPHELARKLRQQNLMTARRILGMIPIEDRSAIEDEIHRGLYGYMYQSDTLALLDRFNACFSNSEFTPEQLQACLDLWASFRLDRSRFTRQLEPLYDEITSHDAHRDIQHARLTHTRSRILKQPLAESDKMKVDMAVHSKYNAALESWARVIAKYQQSLDYVIAQ